MQPDSVECGYNVMKYMRDIIVDQICLTSKVHASLFISIISNFTLFFNVIDQIVYIAP